MWSPDGSLILTMHGIHQDDGSATAGLATIRPDGTDLRYLTDGMGMEHRADWATTPCQSACRRAVLRSCGAGHLKPVEQGAGLCEEDGTPRSEAGGAHPARRQGLYRYLQPRRGSQSRPKGARPPCLTGALRSPFDTAHLEVLEAASR